MAEERTLGLVRAQEPTDDLSKEELQRRLESTRDSISNTVTEIKESIQNQVQAVKDTLDWEEQFRKRPLAWSAGAAGVGFLLGYCLAATAKGESHDGPVEHYRLHESALRLPSGTPLHSSAQQSVGKEDAGPGLWEKVANSPAYEKVRHEVGGVGDAFVNELSSTAKQLIVPAIISTIRDFLGNHLPVASQTSSSNDVGAEANGERFTSSPS